MNLQQLHDIIAAELPQDGTIAKAEHLALDAALRGIRAYQASAPADTTGQKAEAVVNGLLPLLAPVLPALGPYAAIVAFFASEFGVIVDALAPEKIIDNQDGPIVHDAG